VAERTPADELRAAAERLREAGEAAHDGPWAMSKAGREEWPYTAFVTVAADDLYGRIADVWCGAGEENAAWIALAHPGVAEPLATWLEAVANGWDMATKLSRSVIPRGHADHPGLALARVINGGKDS
jgi:hypothetical protein